MQNLYWQNKRMKCKTVNPDQFPVMNKQTNAATTHMPKRSEEIQHIIGRMPTRFGKIITILIIVIFTLLLAFGYLVRYPDVVDGQVTINASQAPLKLVAPLNGKLKLGAFKSQDMVREGEIIAWIDNPANPDDVFSLSKEIEQLSLPVANAYTLYEHLPKKLVLGDLTGPYFNFLNSLKQMADLQSNHLFEKQAATLNQLITEQEKVLTATLTKAATSNENLSLINRFTERDSTLYAQKVLSAADYDRSKINHIAAKDKQQSALSDIANSREEISQTQNRLQETLIQQKEKEHQLSLELITAYRDLNDKVKDWQQKFIFKAPFSGKVQFLKFWNNDQFINAGEPIFTIIPRQQEIIGQVHLPTTGAGKVKAGQEVIVKLEDYPYMEYGSVKGYVDNISLTTNTVQSQQGSMETYLVTIVFPDQLKTNYGATLDFRFEIRGSAEIITNDRKLIHRFFDNMKYILKR